MAPASSTVGGVTHVAEIGPGRGTVWYVLGRLPHDERPAPPPTDAIASGPPIRRASDPSRRPIRPRDESASRRRRQASGPPGDASTLRHARRTRPRAVTRLIAAMIRRWRTRASLRGERSL